MFDTSTFLDCHKGVPAAASHPDHSFLNQVVLNMLPVQVSASKLEAVLESVCGRDTPVEALLPTYREAMRLELEFFAAQPGL